MSPKATLNWNVAPDWRLTASLAKSTRFPTVAELYQLVATGSTYTAPNPDLAAERVRSGELALERALDGGSLRVTLFQENTRDALVAQTSTLPDVAAPVTFVMNVGAIRNRGVEFAAQKDDVLVQGLELSGSVTFVDSTILSNAGFVSPGGTTSVGKHAPYVPRWRATLVGTWRPNAAWAFTLAGRYSGRMYSTVDNTDNTPQCIRRVRPLPRRRRARALADRRALVGVVRHRQSRQREIFPVPPVPAAHPGGGCAACAVTAPRASLVPDSGTPGRPPRDRSAPLVHDISPNLLRHLVTLRWFAVAGQAITVALVVHALGMPLQAVPLWSGIGVLALFNLWAGWRARHVARVAAAEVVAQVCVDIAVLAWLIGCSGGAMNPFAPLFLLPIALVAVALPARWVVLTALLGCTGYAASAHWGRPLPHAHGLFGDTFNLHLAGMAVMFAISVAVITYFPSRLARALRERERELARLRELAARNEGILALATHAAAVAHELNTPLATLTLMLEDQLDDLPAERADLLTMAALVDACRDRVRELAAPADAAATHARGVVRGLDDAIGRWQLVRPTVELARTGVVADAPGLMLDPGIGHLLQVLLNNAADAGERVGDPRVALHVETRADALVGSVRDHGRGLRRTGPGRHAVPRQHAGRSRRRAGAVACDRRTPGRRAFRAGGAGRRRAGRLPPAAAPFCEHAAMNGLLVEDDAVYAHTLQRSLERRGVQLRLAADGTAALAAARAEPPQFVLLDLNLGRESGLTLIEPLRALGADMKIILVTGYASVATAVEAIKRGADHYLAKPVTAQALLRVLVGEADAVAAMATMTPLSRLEWEHIQQALHDAGGSIAAAARLLGMHRRSLQRKLAKRPGPERRSGHDLDG